MPWGNVAVGTLGEFLLGCGCVDWMGGGSCSPFCALHFLFCLWLAPELSSSLLCISASRVQSGVAFNDTWLCPPEKSVPTSSCDKDRKAEPPPPCHCRCHSQPQSSEAAPSGTHSAPGSANHPATGTSRKPGSPLTNTGNSIHRLLKFCCFQARDVLFVLPSK